MAKVFAFIKALPGKIWQQTVNLYNTAKIFAIRAAKEHPGFLMFMGAMILLSPFSEIAAGILAIFLWVALWVAVWISTFSLVEIFWATNKQVIAAAATPANA